MVYDNMIQSILVYALPVLFAITVHEAAHGYAARHFGDNTAWMLGRVTLNPLRHIDPLGTIVIPLLLYVATSGAFVFGYAKPVPVNFGQLRQPKRDMVWVALAGPAANFIQALVWQTLLVLLSWADVYEPFALGICQAGVLVNLVVFAFNLFPMPPLDGGRILVGVLPQRQAMWVSRWEPMGFFIIMALVLTDIFNDLWMMPLMRLAKTAIDLLLWPLP